MKKGMTLFLAASMISSGPAGSLIAQASEAADTDTSIVNLKTDGLTNPLGIDSSTPAFSWQMISEKIGISQKSYQVVVTDESGETVWDSGVVEDDTSTEIIYEGSELQPQQQYTWTVTITDQDGNTYVSEPATFETALMSTSLDAWDGAEWIGADELTLDATSACYFHIRTDVQIPEESGHASLVFGADDFRFENQYFNVDQMSGENYVRAELDVSGVTEDGGTVLNIYRVGYFEGDSADTPFLTVSAEAIPGTNIDELITAANKNETHTLDIEVCASDMTLSIDGTPVIVGITEGEGDAEDTPVTTVTLSELGSGGNYNSYPNLNSIGFYAAPGETATFSNYQLLNVGYGTGTLFDETTGATTAIFDGLDGLTVDGSQITVDGGENGILSYADPSYGSSTMLRSEFTADKEIASARLYVSAQGIYEVSINGEKVSDDWFNPGNSEYRTEISYQTYDITDMLNEGENAIGAQLGSGWWSGYMSYTVSNYNYYGDQPALMAKIDIEYTDGTTATYVTDDATWQYYGDGPMVYDSFFQGERYDATKEANVEGFSSPGFEAEGLRNAAVIETREVFSDYDMVTRYDEPATVVKEVGVSEALGESREGSGSYIYDMGENVIGVPQITIPAEYMDEGSEIIIRYSEVLYPDNEEYVEQNLDGLLMVENYRAALSTDFYISNGEDAVIEPHFTYHGYRYIEITGLKEELPAENIKTLVLSSQPMTATYESSNELTNRLFANVQNSQTSNFLSLPTDCPQRNERMGWLGDAQIFSMAASYNADVYNFYRQWLASVRAEQDETGNIPVYAPSYDTVTEEGVQLNSAFWDGTSWKCAIATIPYNMYIQTGRTEIIEDNMDAMYNYIKYLDNNDFVYTGADGNEVTEPALTSMTGFLADWLSRVDTDATLINNAVYVYMLDIASQMADVIGRTEMAAELSEMYTAAKAAWNSIYIDSETGITRTADGQVQNTQASYATALNYGVVDDSLAEMVAANYEKTVSAPEVTEDNDGVAIVPYTLTTGFSGTPNLVPALTKYGYLDTAYKLFESTDYASWLYPVTQGATSVWERWNSYTVEGGFNGNNSMNSFNHFSLGAISEWMMAYQLGITTKEGVAGYKEFVLQPTVGGTFTYAGGTFESPYGTIESSWTADENGLTSYETTVPANTSATLYLPVEDAGDFAAIDGVTFVGMTEHNGQTVAEFTLLSGSYVFTVADGAVSVDYQA